ncbi:MAG: FecR family protein [Sphingobium sp.]
MSDEERIAKDAAYWIEQINRPAVDTAQSTRFDAWIGADPRHGDAFARLQALWDSSVLEAALNDPELMVDDASVEVQVAEASPLAPRGRVWLLGGGIGLAAAIAAAVPLWLTTGAPQRLSTAKGAGASFTLADGSRVDLGPDAEIAAEYGALSRTVTLVRGEAYFDVRHERWRPFRVASGANEVKVLGTAFNVDRQSDVSTVVEVFRGRVGLGPRNGRLVPIDKGKAGHMDGTRLTMSRIDPGQQGPEWKTGWFEASDVPLATLIDKLNRYSAKPILIRRPDLARRGITGRFRVQAVQDTLRAIEVAYGVHLRETAVSITLE